MEKIEFEKILNQRIINPRTPRKVNSKLTLHADNHFEYINPVCPNCNSYKVIKQEYRPRNPIIDDPVPFRIFLRRYKCKNCGKKFITSLNSVIKSGHRYAKIFKEKLNLLIETGYRSLRKTREDFRNFFGVIPSHQTIQNWLQIKPKNKIKNTKRHYSGYYCYDEQYLRINGDRMYRLTLYDSILNIPVAEEIVPKRTPTAIKNFITQSTKNQPLISITTDHFREYKKIIDELGANHQLCIFHLFKMIGNTVYKKLKSKKLTPPEKVTLCLYFTDIKNIFRTYNQETAIKRLEQLLSHKNRIPPVIRRYLIKKIIPDFQRLTHFTRDHKIPRTSNHVENYYRQTEPEQIKTKYKTKQGILNYLQRKMKNWTKKHQHPTT
jgi:transposase-like protein